MSLFNWPITLHKQETREPLTLSVLSIGAYSAKNGGGSTIYTTTHHRFNVEESIEEILLLCKKSKRNPKITGVK